MRWVSRLVTVIVIAAVIAGGGLWLRSRLPASEYGQSFTTCAVFRDATRLARGSPVMIAGVRVGEIVGLSLEGNLARVDMQLRDDTSVPADSWITKRAYSPFGDSYLEIIPSGAEGGAPLERRLRPGECLTRVLEGTTTDRVLRTLARTMPRVEQGLERIHEVALHGRKWADGTLEDSVLDAERWLNEGHVERPLSRADQALDRLEAATLAAAAAVAGAKPDFPRALDRVERGVAAARARIAELHVTVRDGLAGARAGVDRLDTTASDVEELLGAIDEGRGEDYRGTLGRLVNDPGLGDRLEAASEAAREGVGSFARFKSWLGLRIELNVFARQPRFFVTAEVRARTDKFYLVELERGPLGDFPDGQLADAVGVPEFTRRQQIRDALRFTAQFGKTFGNWFQVRGGLKQSTFGFGADMVLGNGRLRMSGDVYGAFSRIPRVKLAGALEVFRSIYLIAGVDDVLNTPGYLSIVKGNTDVPVQFDRVRYGRDYFLGASLHFDEADLAMLLRVYGALLVGLL